MIKLWPLNTEFEITLEQHYTMNWPMLNIKKIDSDESANYSLIDKGVKDVMKEVFEVFPDSEFLKQLMNIKGV